MLSPTLTDFVEEHENDDISSLALQAAKFKDIDIETAIRQIAGRKIARHKIPAWYANRHIIYPKHLSLEQSSSEQTALYKASLCKGESMADLTGGMGIDFYFMAHNFDTAIYVEQQEELATTATHNFKVLGLQNAVTINEDGVDYLQKMQPASLIYIDPARRNNSGKKTVLIEDCTPNILEIEKLLEQKGQTVMIKLSPMLDISLALSSLSNVSDVHIVSVNNEVKELLFVKQAVANKTQFHCVNIKKDKTDRFSFYKEEEQSAQPVYTETTGKYLYEPNASILKAGAYKIIGEKLSLSKLHPSSHLYTSDSLIGDFQGRVFAVENICSLSKKDIKEHLSNLGQANITTRNFPLSVADIRKKTKLKEGGDTYIFATTIANGDKVLIICRKAMPSVFTET
ncbi:SAM-dependent methyltransferase [Dysgonomonas sp. 511]|uniref:THUMP-like domain-containing protein n=1 Tax=Dysgonomonas sp. 511 TaxID=2302930 RepID=UPI0013D19E94|nr:SAM-dependent methyltransferase [Dysgonomonas sp. 511]NDV78221.1 SAM-dependent methyltransferase [Dysgonomonas sp. 511]